MRTLGKLINRYREFADWCDRADSEHFVRQTLDPISKLGLLLVSLTLGTLLVVGSTIAAIHRSIR